MPSLWFVVPCHGRVDLARVCLRQLRRTCDALVDHGIEATAVIVADDENLTTAHELGFATVDRDNTFLGKKFNDGIQLALDPKFNPRPADYICPMGSDDWIDWRILITLPDPDRVLAFQHLSFVREDGREISAAKVNYPGGCGMRVYSAELMFLLGYRPADEDRTRACDTSILVNLRRAHEVEYGRRLLIAHLQTDPAQIVDWKNSGEQINTFEDVSQWFRGPAGSDPFVALADTYPAEALDEMREVYARAPVMA